MTNKRATLKFAHFNKESETDNVYFQISLGGTMTSEVHSKLTLSSLNSSIKPGGLPNVPKSPNVLPAPKHCTVYNLSQPLSATYKCVDTSLTPSSKVGSE